MSRARAIAAAIGCVLAGALPAAYAAQACPAGIDPDRALELAASLAGAGSRQDAAACYRRALQGPGPNRRPRHVQARLGLARLDQERGDFQQAQRELAGALVEARTGHADDDEPTADVLLELGSVQYRLGRYADAERDLRRAQSAYERTVGPEHGKVALALSRLGAVYRDHGNYDRAEGALAAALAILDRPGSDDPATRASAYGNLAGVAYYRNDYGRAIEYYGAAASLLEALYGESRIEVAQTANNLGLVYFEIGDYEQARRELQRALRLKTALLGPAHASVGSTLSNLGELEAASGDRARARADFLRAEHVLAHSLGPKHPQVATVLLQAGLMNAEAGDAADARPLLERALQIRKRAFGADSVHVAEILNVLAPVWSTLGQPERATAESRRAIAVAATGGERELVWGAYRAHARVLADAHHPAAAAFYGKQAVNCLQAMRAELAPLGRRVPTSFLLRRQSAYRELADTLAGLGRLTEAEQVVALLKQEEFYGLAGAGPMPGADEPAQADYSAAEAMSVSRLDTALAAARASAARSASTEAAPGTRLRREGEGVVTAVASIDDALDRASGRASAATPTPGPGDRARPHEAILTYLVAGDRVRLLVQTAAAHESRVLALGAAALNRKVFDFRQALQDPQSDPLALAGELYRALILPVQSRLELDQVQSLELVLDGTLRYVPFPALHDGGGYLVQRYRIGLRTSLALEAQPDAGAAGERIAAFGVTRAVAGFAALARVREELEGIVRSERPDSPGVVPGVIVLDEAFTEERLRRELAQGYALVHVASHFVLRPGRLAESYLLTGDGGRLTLERLRSGAFSFQGIRLLTLSACSTAIGEPDATGAEFESLGVLAGRLGAHQVLATLWPVADRSTAILMRSLYRRLQQDPAAALAAAQRTMLEAGEGHGPYAHPFYWAPFVVFGNDRGAQGSPRRGRAMPAHDHGASAAIR